jgi:23S rRNA pseudouridine1911/1915/1917 synthase
MTPLLITVDAPAPRLDRFLAAALGDRSRAELQRWIEEGHITVNGAACKASRRLLPGDAIVVAPPAPRPAELVPEPIPLVVLYEDADLLVVDKPAGLVVHPAAGHTDGTLVNAILHHCPDIEGVGGVQRPGIVHRLDKDTSGIILVAKNDACHRYLQAQFKARTVQKTYLALVHGRPAPPAGRIVAPIGRDPRRRYRMAVVAPDAGREAVTDYETVEALPDVTLMAAHPRTGRTHQIRVHFAAAGHPLVGDPLYGPSRDRFRLGRQFLHAHRLVFRRPSDGAEIELTSPLPADLQRLLDRLRA